MVKWIWLYKFVMSAADGSEQSTSGHSHSFHGERDTGIHWKGAWVDWTVRTSY
jgi:hypothetical protein